jgi:endonuclease/exonuclease/phosphatase family metal-dependent hydrolase
VSRYKSTKRKGLYRLLRWFTVLVSALTIISLLSPVVSPVTFWPLALFGLLFPYLFLLNILLLLFYISGKKFFLIIPLTAVIAGSFKLPLIMQLDGSNGKPEEISFDDEIKLMSFNVRVFDLYNWTHNLETRKKILDLIESENPSILCLQEFYSSDKEKFNNLKLVHERINTPYDHVEYSITLRGTDHWGIATFSAFPIINKGILNFDDKKSNVCIYSDIKINEDTIRVYNTHLQSVRFKDEDYKFIESIGGDEEEDQENIIRTKAILSRLRLAYVKRAHQAEIITAHIKESPYPVIVNGDFNDTPVSYCYHTISKGLTDAFRCSGIGFGSTYSGPIPGLRIDYILHSDAIGSYDFKVKKINLSDHYPLVCNIVLPSDK